MPPARPRRRRPIVPTVGSGALLAALLLACDATPPRVAAPESAPAPSSGADLGPLRLITRGPDARPGPLSVVRDGDAIVGRSTLDRPVRCLLLEVRGARRDYGVYGLWGAKATLTMPLPSSPSTITWDGVPADAALVRVLGMGGLDRTVARAVVDAHAATWFAEGLRAVLVADARGDDDEPPVVHCFELPTEPAG